MIAFCRKKTVFQIAMPKLCLYFDYLLTLLEDILHGSAVVMVEDVVDEVVVDDVVVVNSVLPVPPEDALMSSALKI